MRRVTPLAPLAIFLMAYLLFGCTSNEIPKEEAPLEPPNLVGTWKVDLPQRIIDSAKKAGRDPELTWPIMTFMDETKWSVGTASTPASHMSGTYVIEDRVAKLQIELLGGRETDLQRTFLISDDGNKLSAPNEFNGERETLTRQ